jgi:integrase
MKELTTGSHGLITLTPQRKDENGRWAKTSPSRAKRWLASTNVKFNNGDTAQRRVTAPTKTDAYDALLKKLSQDSSTKPTSYRAEQPFADAVEIWKSALLKSNKADRTKETYVGAIDRYFPPLNKLSLKEVNTASIIRDWQQNIATNNGTGAASQARKVLRMVLSDAFADDAISANNLDKTKALPGVKTERAGRALNQEETKALVAMARSDKYAHLDIGNLIEVALATGLRSAEIAALRWTDIDFAANVIRMGAVGTKTTNSKEDITLQFARDLLEQRAQRLGNPEPLHRVFPNPGKPDHTTKTDATKRRDMSNVRKSLKKMAADAGLDWQPSTHNFRDTCATRLIEESKPVNAIARYMRHSVQVLINDYIDNRITPERQAEMLGVATAAAR